MLEQVVVLSKCVPRLLLKLCCCLLLCLGVHELTGEALAASSITCKCGGQQYQGVCPAGQTALRCDCKGMAVLCQTQASKAPAAKAKAAGNVGKGGGKQAGKASAKTAQKGASKSGKKANASKAKATQKKGKKPSKQQAKKSKQKAAGKVATKPAKPASKPAE